MNRLFGTKRAKQAPPDLNECVTNIDNRAEAIERKIDRYNADLKKISEQMGKMRDGQQAKNLLRQRAINLLRQQESQSVDERLLKENIFVWANPGALCKQYEQQLDMLRQQSFNIEQQRMTLESVKDNQVAVNAMRSGVVEMKREMRRIKLNEVDKLQDELEDYMFQADELQEALGRTYNAPEYDDTELEAELEAISADLDTADVGADGKESSLNYLDEMVMNAPTVPGREPSQRQTIETDEFGLPVLPNRG